MSASYKATDGAISWGEGLHLSTRFNGSLCSYALGGPGGLLLQISNTAIGEHPAGFCFLSVDGGANLNLRHWNNSVDPGPVPCQAIMRPEG